MKNRLREVRKKQRYSQQLLAKESGVSRATIIGIETGRIQNTTSDTLMKLANALGVTVRDIFLPTDGRTAGGITARTGQAKEEDMTHLLQVIAVTLNFMLLLVGLWAVSTLAVELMTRKSRPREGNPRSGTGSYTFTV